MRFVLVFLMILVSLKSFAQDSEMVQYSRVYLLTGYASVDESKTDASKTKKSIHTLGVSFRIATSGHMGLYYSTNDHYGWIGGIDLSDEFRIRFMIGQAKLTDTPAANAAYVGLNPPDDRVYTFGGGFDFSVNRIVGITFQGFSYDSGNDSSNYELSVGATFSF